MVCVLPGPQTPILLTNSTAVEQIMNPQEFLQEKLLNKKKRNTFSNKNKAVLDFFENIVPSRCFFLGFI